MPCGRKREREDMGLGNKLLCLLYPPRCPFCGRVTPDGAPCPSCAEELSQTPPVQAPFPGVEGSYSRLIAAYDYAGMIRQAILRYKKLGQRDSDLLLAGFVSVALRRQSDVGEFDLVTPAPGGSNSRARGFDAGERIALQTARLLSLPFCPAFLPHAGRAQKELSQKERLQAVMDTRMREDLPPLYGLHVLLVDDVVTTGATVRRCGTLLRQAGAAQVTAAAVAISEKA